jgi:hypothetical protein
MISIPRFRPIAIDPIYVGQPVSGTVFERAAKLSNWLQAQGGMIVPWCAIGSTITAGTVRKLLFRTQARPRATHRVWSIVWSQTAGGTVEVQLPSGETFFLLPTVSPAILLETLAARASAEETLEIVVTATTNSAVIHSLACFEKTREELEAVADDHGIELTSLRGERPIYDPDFRSLGGLDAAYQSIASHARRWHYYWTAAHADASTVSGGVMTTSGTFVDVLPLAVKVQGTKRYVGDTETLLHVEVYAAASGGAGEVQAVTGLGSDAVTVNGAGFYQLEVSIACTDLSDPLGGTLDELQIQMRKTTGTSITVGGVSAYEDPV